MRYNQYSLVLLPTLKVITHSKEITHFKIYKTQIQIRIRFGIANSINMYFRLKIHTSLYEVLKLNKY